MDFLSLIDKYPATINGVVGAAIGVIGWLAGVAITSWFNLKAKDKEAKNSRILRLRTYGDQLLEEKFRVFTQKRLRGRH